MTEAICPEGSNVLVKVDDVKEMIGVIHVPEEAQANMQALCTTGTLVGMGPAATLAYFKDGKSVEVERENLPIRVLYTRYGGTPVKIKGEGREITSYKLLTERDVTAVLFDENIEIPQGV